MMGEAQMADENKDDETPKPQNGDLKQAHPHQKDKGTVVRTAFGEPMSGGVADIADGDDER
jgi:hypothetical protein